MSGLGRVLLVAGVLLAVVGALLTWGPRIPWLGWLGRLPGDIRIEREGFRFYFPLATSLVLSVVVTLVLRLLGKR
jgi:hypothetical protein